MVGVSDVDGVSVVVVVGVVIGVIVGVSSVSIDPCQYTFK